MFIWPKVSASFSLLKWKFFRRVEGFGIGIGNGIGLLHHYKTVILGILSFW
jgi:hypothetical protein